MKRRLIVVAKRPLPGRVKTRLAPDVGEEEAAGVYGRLLYATLLKFVRPVLPKLELELSVASPVHVPFFALAFPEFAVRPQHEGDLGQRLERAFANAFADGCEDVVVVASDVPDLSPALVRTAFDTLERAPLIIGPCQDGGYYLLGMRAPGAALFQDIDWSTDRVLAQTEALAEAQDLTMIRLPRLFDVDTADDLALWHRRLNRPSP